MNLPNYYTNEAGLRRSIRQRRERERQARHGSPLSGSMSPYSVPGNSPISPICERRATPEYYSRSNDRGLSPSWNSGAASQVLSEYHNRTLTPTRGDIRRGASPRGMYSANPGGYVSSNDQSMPPQSLNNTFGTPIASNPIDFSADSIVAGPSHGAGNWMVSTPTHRRARTPDLNTTPVFNAYDPVIDFEDDSFIAGPGLGRGRGGIMFATPDGGHAPPPPDFGNLSRSMNQSTLNQIIADLSDPTPPMRSPETRTEENCVTQIGCNPLDEGERCPICQIMDHSTTSGIQTKCCRSSLCSYCVKKCCVDGRRAGEHTFICPYCRRSVWVATPVAQMCAQQAEDMERNHPSRLEETILDASGRAGNTQEYNDYMFERCADDSI